MKASEIRKLSAKELDAKLLELKDELFKLRFQQAVNQLDNPMRISAVKKDIARALRQFSAISSFTAPIRDEREVNTYGKKPQKNSRWHCDQR